MTIASAITAAQGRVANCYTSVDTMGGTLPEVQNLTNLPAAIESIPQGGGGDTVLAHRSISDTLEIDDKVLIKYSVRDSQKEQEYSTNAATNYKYKTYIAPVWFDNDTFSIFGEHATLSYKYSYNGSQWSRGQLTSWSDIYTSAIANFCYTDKGIMYVENKQGSTGSNLKRIIANSDGTYTNIQSGITPQTLENYGATINGDIIWSGATQGYNVPSIYLGTTAITRGSNYWLMYVDKNNSKLLYQAGYNDSSYYHIVEFSGTTVTSDTVSSYGGSNFIIGCTGLAEGDYVLLCPSDANSYNNYKTEHTAASPAGISPISFIVYKVSNNNTLVPIDSTDPLAAYTSLEKSIWHFDNCNNCLTIGTTDAVYVLEFISSSKTWKMLLTISSPLPSNNSGQYIYNATLSPDKTKLAIYAGDSQYLSQNLFIYDVGSGYTWTVVKNNSQNYDSVTAFTGIYKGTAYNVETQEYFDMVSTALPPDGTVTCSLTSDYEPELSIL